MLPRLALLIALLAALPAVALGDEQSVSRERRVKCALALSASKPSAGAIPAPHAVTFPDYATAYKQATAERRVLLCYVGCSGRHPIERIEGCVVSLTPTLAGYKQGTILVAYPVGDTLSVQATFLCSDHGSEKVKDAVKAAGAKVERPVKADRAAPVPLNWSL